MSAVMRPLIPVDPTPRASGWRRWLAPVVSPPVVDFWLRKLNPVLSWDRPLARVVARSQESRDAVTLVLKPNRHFRGYVPGQHVNLTAELDGVRVTRSYSPTDVRQADGAFSITVKHIPGGRVSGLLCERTQVGDVLELGPGDAFGEMHLPREVPEKMLLLAAGSGITPLMSLVRQLSALGMPADTTLLYWTRQRDERCFTAELRAIAARHPHFRVRFLLTRDAPQKPDEAVGRIDSALLLRKAPDLAKRTVFACGPAGFVRAARELATDAPRFCGEAFTPAAMVQGDGGTVRVELRRSRKTLELASGMPLLAALEAEGLQPLYGCRRGICQTCACGKLAGVSRNLDTGELQAEPEQALRLCVSSARSDLVLDI